MNRPLPRFPPHSPRCGGRPASCCADGRVPSLRGCQNMRQSCRDDSQSSASPMTAALTGFVGSAIRTRFQIRRRRRHHNVPQAHFTTRSVISRSRQRTFHAPQGAFHAARKGGILLPAAKTTGAAVSRRRSACGYSIVRGRLYAFAFCFGASGFLPTMRRMTNRVASVSTAPMAMEITAFCTKPAMM